VGRLTSSADQRLCGPAVQRSGSAGKMSFLVSNTNRADRGAVETKATEWVGWLRGTAKPRTRWSFPFGFCWMNAPWRHRSKICGILSEMAWKLEERRKKSARLWNLDNQAVAFSGPQRLSGCTLT
jgi:hypothetical protein